MSGHLSAAISVDRESRMDQYTGVRSVGHRGESIRQWVTGLVIIAATIVGFYGFAQLSRGWTLVISVAVLAGLLIFFWIVGRKAGPRSPR